MHPHSRMTIQINQSNFLTHQPNEPFGNMALHFSGNAYKAIPLFIKLCVCTFDQLLIYIPELIQTGVRFGIRPSMNLVYQYRTSLRLGDQKFVIRYGFELQIGTLLCQNLEQRHGLISKHFNYNAHTLTIQIPNYPTVNIIQYLGS